MWLFESSRHEDGTRPPALLAAVDNVQVNGRHATPMTGPLMNTARIDDVDRGEGSEVPRAKRTVTILVERSAVRFDGRAVEWEDLASVLSDTPGPERTGLCVTAAGSGHEPGVWNQVKARISILSRGLGFRYLSCTGDATAKEPCPEYFFTSPVEVNRDIGIGQDGMGDFPQKRYRTEKGWATDESEAHREQTTVHVNSIRFHRSWLKAGGSGTLKVVGRSWPRGRWRFTIRLFDSQGACFAKKTVTFDTGGYLVSGRVLQMVRELDFSFDRPVDVSETAFFEVAVGPRFGAAAPAVR